MTTLLEERLVPPGPQEEFDVSFPEHTLERMYALFITYGDIYKLFSPLTRSDIYVVNHPDYARHVLFTNQRNYTKGIGIDRVKILLGNGIMVSEGDFWKAQRKMIQPAFHRNVLARLVGLVRECSLDLLEKWERSATKQERINVTQDMSDLALRIILKAIFGEDLDAIIRMQGSNPFSILTDEPARNLHFAQRFRALAKLVLGCVNERRKDHRHAFDLLTMLMDARDKHTGKPMGDKQLVRASPSQQVPGRVSANTLQWSRCRFMSQQ